MSQQRKIADMTKAINIFTKTLLWKITEGHPVEQEEIDALNEARVEAGMKPLNIAAVPASSEKVPEPRKTPPAAPFQHQTPRSQSEGKPPRGGRKPPKTTDNTPFNPEAIAINGRTFEGQLLPEGRDWTNRFYIKSESSDNLYTIAQNKRRRYWGCDCPGWIGHRKCKHLKALELPWFEEPYEAQIGPAATAGKTSSTLIKFADDDYGDAAHILAAEVIHNDAELSKLMELAVPEAEGVAHIEGPEAGPSNDELHANQHPENGVPVTDGNLKHPERQNMNAMREALETQVEMEVGKPIDQKQQEVSMQEKVQDVALAQGAGSLAGSAGMAEVSAKPGTQIVINVASMDNKTVSALPAVENGYCTACNRPVIYCEHAEAYHAAYMQRLERAKKDRKKDAAVRKVSYVVHVPGHKNSKGEAAPWVIKQHDTGKILESFKSEAAAKEGLKNMESHKHGAQDWTGYSQCSMCGKHYMPENNGDGKSPCCTADPKGEEQMDKQSAVKWCCDYNVPEEDKVVCNKCGEEHDMNQHARTGSTCPNCKRGQLVFPSRTPGIKQGAEPIGGEDDSKITSGHGGGSFGGTDLEGPSFKTPFHVGFVFRGTRREASFSSLKEAQKFVKGASARFGKAASGWTMKMSAADPAKRNLVLEILSHGPKTTGEIEKALGGGKYTNTAYPVLQELAKEGLLKHKQMRWSLKAASMKKSYRIGKKIALSVETHTNAENQTDVLKQVIDRLNEIHADLKKKDPQGFMDSFESRLPSFMMDIAQSLGLQADYTPESDTYVFYDQAGAGTKGKDFEEFQRQTGSVKSATIRVTSAKPMPRKGTPEWAELKIAIQTLKMPEAIADVMGGPGTEHAHEVLARYGLRWDEAAYMADGSGVKQAGEVPSNTGLGRQIENGIGAARAIKNIVDGVLEEQTQFLKSKGLTWEQARSLPKKSKNQLQAEWTEFRSKQAGDGMAKTEEQIDKEAGFNFFFPGQVLKEFYPDIQHEIVDYPNATNQPMSGAGNPEIVGDDSGEIEGMLDSALDTNIVEMIQLPADVGEIEPLARAAADYSSTKPGGGMGIGRDGKPEVLEGIPLRKENDIRGYMFTDEFYGQYSGIPGAAIAVASKTAAEGDESKQFALFLKKVCGEIAATLVGAFKITQRPLLDKVPGIGELQLDVIEQGSPNTMPLGQTTQGGRVRWLMGKLNDGEIKTAINEAWAQAAVWNDNPDGGFVYEVFVRPETIDTESLIMKYRFVCGTRE